VKGLNTLRRVDPRACAARQLTQGWQAQGHDASVSAPSAECTYLAFVTQGPRGPWRGLIGAQQWLQAVLPQLDALLPTACADVDIVRLFLAHGRPLQIPVADLDYQSISGLELVDGCLLSGVRLPCLITQQGPLWLVDTVPASNAAHLSLPAWINKLPLYLNLTLGNGLLHPGQFMQLACGDVLPITERTQHLSLADRYVGRFTLTEEGFHMEFTDPPTALDQIGDGDLPIPINTLSHLPVRLEFVLQQSTCSLAELAAFSTGQVLPLLPSAQQSVEVRANGKTVAFGELVQWGECLGVELHKVCQGAWE